MGPFDLNWETQQYKCRLSQVITFMLLACLQAVNCFWLFLILRIAKKYLLTSVAADERSDDEDEGEEGEDENRGADATKVETLESRADTKVASQAVLNDHRPGESAISTVAETRPQVDGAVIARNSATQDPEPRRSRRKKA